MMNRTYAVVENTFANDSFKIRFAGEKSEPLFVARDIISAMGYKDTNCAATLTKSLPGRCEINRTQETGRGNYIMIGLTFDDVEMFLASRHRSNVAPGIEKFRAFWDEEVVPKVKYPAAKAKISDLETELAKVRAELELYKSGKITQILNETA